MTQFLLKGAVEIQKKNLREKMIQNRRETFFQK